MKFIMRWVSVSIAVGAAIYFVPGITTTGGSDAWVPVVCVALLLAFVNAIVKPVVKVLSLPVTIITLGAFLLVINALMLELASVLSISLFGVGLVIRSFGSAIMAGIIISLVSAVANWVLDA